MTASFKFNQNRVITEAEFIVLKQENSALKNQVNQHKEIIENLKVSEVSINTRESTTSTKAAGGKRKFNERDKKAKDTRPKLPAPPRANVGGFKILPMVTNRRKRR